MSESIPTFRYELPLDNGLVNRQLVELNEEMTWLVLTAATTGTEPAEVPVTVQLQWGGNQKHLYTTPVSFTGIRVGPECRPHSGGLIVTAPARAGLVLIAQGGL